MIVRILIEILIALPLSAFVIYLFLMSVDGGDE
jgi:hypothetical protein